MRNYAITIEPDLDASRAHNKLSTLENHTLFFFCSVEVASKRYHTEGVTRKREIENPLNA